MEQSANPVSDNLKNIREGRNLSLDKLSEMTGVSKSMLRQIEIGQSNPTIAMIWKIANGLRIPFTALLRDQPQEILLRQFKQAEPLRGETEGYRLYPLIVFDPERAFEVYYVEIDPGTVLDAEPHQGNAEEHVFVFQGQIEITIGNESFPVRRESFISFQANQPHRYENTGEDRVAALMLISYLA